MRQFILKKILFMLPMMIAISFLVFLALQFSPVDPINYLISPDMASDPARLAALRAKLGLDQPLVVRYFQWVWNICHGDFGYSLTSGQPINELIGRTLPATFELAFSALILSTIIGLFVGIVSAVHQNGIVDNLSRFLAVLGTAIPEFFFGILILNLFAIKLGWLPVGGRYSITDPGFWGGLKHLALPAVAMSISLVSALMRYTRNSMLDVMNADYVKTARAKGVPEWKVYIKHVFRNAFRPVLVLIIFRLPLLISGSIIIETVFSWPGIGQVIINGVTSGDYPVIMVTTLMVAITILLASLLVDVLAALLDPRIRY